MQKIPCACDERMLSLRAPLDERLAVQNVRHGFLRAVMMNPGLRSRLDQKRAAPERRVNSQFRRHGREPLRARRLRSSRAELIGMDDADRGRIALVHARFDAVGRAGLQRCTLRAGRLENMPVAMNEPPSYEQQPPADVNGDRFPKRMQLLFTIDAPLRTAQRVRRYAGKL
jgi:hypothetical protein